MKNLKPFCIRFFADVQNDTTGFSQLDMAEYRDEASQKTGMTLTHGMTIE